MFGNAFAESQPTFVESYEKVDVATAQEFVEWNPTVVVVDTRQPSSYNMGHIETAVNIPIDQLTKENLAQHVTSPGTPVLFYCNASDCNASEDAAKVATVLGFNNAHVLPGGIDSWNNKGLPTVR